MLNTLKGNGFDCLLTLISTKMEDPRPLQVCTNICFIFAHTGARVIRVMQLTFPAHLRRLDTAKFHISNNLTSNPLFNLCRQNLKFRLHFDRSYILRNYTHIIFSEDDVIKGLRLEILPSKCHKKATKFIITDNILLIIT